LWICALRPNGYKVYAIDDGVIVRLAVQKYGFWQRAVYRTSAWLMSVYGHLDRFENKTLDCKPWWQQQRQQRNSKYRAIFT
jgi:hypothetical protein